MKKLISILSSLSLVTSASAVAVSCGNTTDNSESNPQKDSAKINDIKNQSLYEQDNKIVLVRINKIVKNAKIEVTSSNEEVLHAALKENISEENQNYFLIELIGKWANKEAKVTVKYDDSVKTFDCKVLSQIENRPSFNPINELPKISKEIETPFKLDVANRIKGSEYELTIVQDDIATIKTNSGTDENIENPIVLNIKGIKVGSFDIIVNYGAVQSMFKLVVVNNDPNAKPEISDIADLEMSVESTVKREAIVFNPRKDLNLEVKLTNGEDSEYIDVIKTDLNAENGIYLIELNAKKVKKEAISISVNYGEATKEFNATIKEKPVFNEIGKLEVFEKRQSIAKIKVENPIKNEKITVEIIEGKENVDAFSMRDWDTDRSGEFDLVLYGLSATEKCIVKLTYGNVSKEVEVKVSKAEVKDPVIQGINKERKYELNHYQSLSILIYIDNETSKGILKTTFVKNEYLNVEIAGREGDPYYTVFLVSSNKDTEQDQDVTLTYEGAQSITFKVKVSSK
ncbi:hypothetical protein SLITO_v1c05770 [Spiroplasma litorale]|uniref:Lipoprotein n=1 Tax=Spiroplasma litorale TaxID=216942 RepID=A0A0K1W210_9MOLU|nr:lipoprotein [Spiroplasma litorale]AKX34213.1 hypothetical protein SLITO_v1c05770 [Spiroplasma litorale]